MSETMLLGVKSWFPSIKIPEKQLRSTKLRRAISGIYKSGSSVSFDDGAKLKIEFSNYYYSYFCANLRREECWGLHMVLRNPLFQLLIIILLGISIHYIKPTNSVSNSPLS